MTETTDFFHDRVAEIIAAYGSDTARWPDVERATAVTLIAADPALTAALAAARGLDHDLIAWASRPVRTGNPLTDAVAAMRRPHRFMRWAAGGSVAASVAAALVLLTPTRVAAPSVAPVVLAHVPDETAFAQVFTPTPDEERIL